MKMHWHFGVPYLINENDSVSKEDTIGNLLVCSIQLCVKQINIFHVLSHPEYQCKIIHNQSLII